MGQKPEGPIGREDSAPFLDTSRPNVARIYDSMLGGKENYFADREVAAYLGRVLPESYAAARQNRDFLQRSVCFLTSEAGIRQFIDIGTGLPTQGNVHEVAQAIDADTRVVYVDYDPVVVSHAQALLANDKTVKAINGDLRCPDEILHNPTLREIISFDEPVAVLLVAVLHFITDAENPLAVTDSLKAAMPDGSYLVLSHITADRVSAKANQKAQDIYRGATAPAVPRSHAAIMDFFGGLEILTPGVVDIREWRPNHSPPGRDTRTLIYGGAGYKPSLRHPPVGGM